MDMNLEMNQKQKKVKKGMNVKKVTITGMLSALSIVLYMTLHFHLPIMPSFISLDFSEVPAIIAAFTLGPVYGVGVCLIKNIIHMLVSSSMWIGELSNFIIGTAFTLTSGYIYKHRTKKNRKSVIISGTFGALAMAIVGVVSNYFVIYPLYFTVWPKEAVLGMYQVILPSVKNIFEALVIFNMPFTFCKAMICVVVVALIYKPLARIINN